MDTDGGSTPTLLCCARDGVETRLRCSECGAPICPKCMVRTDVGLRCPTCGAASGPPVHLGGASRKGRLLAALAVVVALIVAGGAFAATRQGSGTLADDEEVGGERVVVPRTTLGTGELPDGGTWTLAARREGSVCTLLTTSPGSQAREQCLRSRGYRPVGNTSTRILRRPMGTIYLTVGQASERAERIRVTPDGAAPFEVPRSAVGPASMSASS